VLPSNDFKNAALPPIPAPGELAEAAYKNNMEAVKDLLRRGADVDDRNEAGGTPLLYAAANGYEELLLFLISKGAALDLTNKGGNTALMCAAALGEEKMARLLIAKGAKLDVRNEEGNTAEEIAEQREHPEIVLMLRQAADAIRDRQLACQALIKKKQKFFRTHAPRVIIGPAPTAAGL